MDPTASNAEVLQPDVAGCLPYRHVAYYVHAGPCSNGHHDIFYVVVQDGVKGGVPTLAPKKKKAEGEAATDKQAAAAE